VAGDRGDSRRVAAGRPQEARAALIRQPSGPPPYTRPLSGRAAAKLSLALALKEVRALHHNYIGTEHVLLGLLRAAERYPRGDFAAVTLPDLGLDRGRLRAQVVDELRQLQA